MMDPCGSSWMPRWHAWSLELMEKFILDKGKSPHGEICAGFFNIYIKSLQ